MCRFAWIQRRAADPSHTHKQFVIIKQMLAQHPVGIARIAKETAPHFFARPRRGDAANRSVRRNRTPFNSPGLFEEHVSEVRDREGQQLCLLFLGSKKNKVDKAFGHSRCQVGKIDLLLPLDVLLNQFIDFTVQAALR
jgi:hypothetical protein